MDRNRALYAVLHRTIHFLAHNKSCAVFWLDMGCANEVWCGRRHFFGDRFNSCRLTFLVFYWERKIAMEDEQVTYWRERAIRAQCVIGVMGGLAALGQKEFPERWLEVILSLAKNSHAEIEHDLLLRMGKLEAIRLKTQIAVQLKALFPLLGDDEIQTIIDNLEDKNDTRT
jgi:hypothetical protein